MSERQVHGSRAPGAAPRAAMAAAMAVALAATGCAQKPHEAAETRRGMNTAVTVRAVAPDRATAQAALAAAWAEMERCESALNRYDPDADVARVNRDAGLPQEPVDPVVTGCLSAAREVHDLTDGAFDPTVGPLLDLWAEAARRDREPTEEEIREALERVGMDKVEVIASAVAPWPGGNVSPPGGSGEAPGTMMLHVVQLNRKGMVLDLGGIAKGYAAGRMAARMEQAGAIAGLIDAGGDVYALGRRPGSLAPKGADPRWGVGVRDPRFPYDPTEGAKLYTALRVADRAAVTSGHYERGYEIGGKQFSHILDPRTGRPVNRQIASVTVVAPDAALADGLSTALAVLGAEKGLALVEELEGVECLILEVPAEQLGAADPAEVDLVARRSSGFAALEFDPEADVRRQGAGSRP